MAEAFSSGRMLERAAGIGTDVRDAMLATGLVDAAQIDAAVRALASPAFAALSPGMITAWGGCRA
jgi:hypothetical protein